jgi:hypothetical protein
VRLLILSLLCADPAGVLLVPTIADSADMAAADVREAATAGLDPATLRYVFIPDANDVDAALVSFVANSVLSRSAVNFVPSRVGSPIQAVADGRLIRLDFRGLVPDATQRQQSLTAWDAIANPYYLHGDKHAQHIDELTASELTAATGSHNAVVWVQTFYQRTLTQRDGGLYYKFMGFRRAGVAEKTARQTDFDLFLRDFMGLDQGTIERLGAEQRTAMTFSQVTGKPRSISYLAGPHRPGANQGLVIITNDVFDDRSQPEKDPWLNLLTYSDDGHEIIFERPNGHLGYLLTNAEGELVDEAPPNLVADHEIPRPFTRRLEPAISCIRCHSKPGEDGWKPAPNEVRQAILGGLQLVGDRSTKAPAAEVADRLYALYAGDLEKPLRRSREDHSDAVVISTDGAVTDAGLPWQFEDIGRELSARFAAQAYAPVTPLAACRELGYLVADEASAVRMFGRLMGVKVDEDVRIALLRQGIPIHRTQWEQIYIDAAVRSQIHGE